MYRLLIVLAIASSACATMAPRHNAVVVDVSVYEVLNDVHASEQTALCGQPSCANSTEVEHLKGWTKDKSVDFNKKLLPGVQAGREFNQVLSTWKPGTPVPDQIRALVTSISDSLRAISTDMPDGPTKSTILTDLGKTEAAILGALEVVLTVKG